jgi:hypothetical protein
MMDNLSAIITEMRQENDMILATLDSATTNRTDPEKLHACLNKATTHAQICQEQLSQFKLPHENREESSYLPN